LYVTVFVCFPHSIYSFYQNLNDWQSAARRDDN
jgi:hypothetical protein